MSVNKSQFHFEMKEANIKIINWVQLSDRFKSIRGVGVGYHTIQGWQAIGMPHIRQGRLIFYQWDACWEWYLDQFSVDQAI